MLQGKIAVVTGGSRGIGRAVCMELARQGAVVLFSYAGKEEAARQTEQLCQKAGGKALAKQVNVTDGQAVKKWINEIAQQWGTVDILVNNAGITRDGLALAMKEEAFDQVIDTNLKGTFLCCQAVAGIMLKKRQGRIINISSVVGLRGNAGQVNYAASKAGVIGLTKSLAKELAGRNITVNAVAPGFIETDMTAVLPERVRQEILTGIPMKKLGSGADVAAAVAFFASPVAAYVTGQILCVDGGMAM